MSEKILDRVKKLMALANDSAASEGERENALRMAFKTLAKHNLSMTDVEAHKQEGEEARIQDQTEFVVYPWARQIANIIGDLFFCKYYFIRSGTGKMAKHVFIGRASNATTASYMAHFVVHSVLREAARLYGSAIAPEARSFATGVESRLRQRVREIKESFAKNNDEESKKAGTALVLASLYDSERQANALWLQEQNVRLRQTNSHRKGIADANAYHSGQAFGSRVSLSPQVGTARSSFKQLG